MKELFYRLFAFFFNISSALFSVKENRVTLLSPHNASFNDSLGEIRREFEGRGEFDFNLISHKDFASIVSALFFFTKKAYLLATSRYVFMNDNFMPLGYLKFRKETAVVQLAEYFAHRIAVKLAPAFVEDGPVEDTGVIFQLFDGCLHGF